MCVAAARLFAREGCAVVVSDIDAEKTKQVVNEIKAAGGRAIGVAGDVTANDFADNIVKATIK